MRGFTVKTRCDEQIPMGAHSGVNHRLLGPANIAPISRVEAPEPAKCGWPVYLAAPAGAALSPLARKFHDWVLAETAAGEGSD